MTKEKQLWGADDWIKVISMMNHESVVQSVDLIKQITMK